MNEFDLQSKLRDLDTEYRLLRKLTETKEHLANQETFEKVAAKLNRYSDLKPCKYNYLKYALKLSIHELDWLKEMQISMTLI